MNMKSNEIRETLEKQMQLLSERSQSSTFNSNDSLVELTHAMCEIANILSETSNQVF